MDGERLPALLHLNLCDGLTLSLALHAEETLDETSNGLSCGLVTCAGVLATPLPAQAQGAPPPATDPSLSEPPPHRPPEGSPTTSPPAPEGSPEAEPAPEDPPEVYGEELPEVVVNRLWPQPGSRPPEEAKSNRQVDAIVAEDIAEFPDLNLAESLQRIPGVAITRTTVKAVRSPCAAFRAVHADSYQRDGSAGQRWQWQHRDWFRRSGFRF
jgi:hypothetical protein